MTVVNTRGSTDSVHKLSQHFAALIEGLMPDSKRAKAAQTYPDMIREFVEASSLIATVEPHTRLVGSYARDVADPLVKDVDVATIVSEDYGSDPSGALDDLTRAVDAFRRELDRETELEVARREQRRSVRLHFKDPDFFIDVVPIRAPTGVEETLWVPDREWSSWVKTWCVPYVGFFHELNGQLGAKLIPVIKILKHWRARHLPATGLLKTFWLESANVNIVTAGGIDFSERGMADIVADLFFTLEAQWAPHLETGSVPFVSDPMSSTSDVAWNWKREAFEVAMKELGEACQAIEIAVTTDDKDVAVSQWRRVFDPELFALSEKATWRPPTGGLPLVTPRPEPRPHRFYGR